MKPDRTYICIKFANAIDLWNSVALVLPKQDLVPVAELHTTLMYSTDPFVQIEPKLLGIKIGMENQRLELFGENKDVLVLRYDSDIVQDEFRRLRLEYGLNHSYSELLPHITLIEHYTGSVDQIKAIALPRLPILVVSEEKSELLRY